MKNGKKRSVKNKLDFCCILLSGVSIVRALGRVRAKIWDIRAQALVLRRGGLCPNLDDCHDHEISWNREFEDL